MSKIISYRNSIVKGNEEKISLRTLNGKTGYRITKFQILPGNMEVGSNEATVKIYKAKQNNVDGVIDFSDNELLGCAVYLRDQAVVATTSDTIIFDNKKFNQDIFITYSETQSSWDFINYYLEMEVAALTDIEATMMTLQSIRDLQGQRA